MPIRPRLRTALIAGGAALLALGGLLLGWRGGSKPPARKVAAIASAQRLEQHVRWLCAKSPRDLTQEQTLDDIARELAVLLEQRGGRVEVESFTTPHGVFKNVSAKFGPGVGPRAIVGAHYDADGDGPAADDNASGVAGLLELAELLRQQPPAGAVELVAFALEENPAFRTGSMGSMVHARRMKKEGVEVRAMFSLEMLGYYRDEPDTQRYPIAPLSLKFGTTGDFLAVVGRLGEDGLVGRVARAMRVTDLRIESLAAPRSMKGVDFSDHQSYWNEGFPAVMITDTAFFRNPHYHQRSDTPETLDYRRMAMAVDAIANAVRELASGP